MVRRVTKSVLFLLVVFQCAVIARAGVDQIVAEAKTAGFSAIESSATAPKIPQPVRVLDNHVHERRGATGNVLSVDKTLDASGIEAAPCARRPTKSIVCKLPHPVMPIEPRASLMLGRGLRELLAREKLQSEPVFLPAHSYTTKNGPSTFSCYHKKIQVNCRSTESITWGPNGPSVTVTIKCDEVDAPGHDCTCIDGCS